MNLPSTSISAGVIALKPSPAAERSGENLRSICPFHDGSATLDALLAELDPADTALFDAALDLRTLCVDRADPTACVEQLFRVRDLLDDRHYLAFYRVRCWASKELRIERRPSRAQPWESLAFPLAGGRVDEVVNVTLAELAVDGEIPPSAHIRFAFAPV